jgi:hypothetical protein
MIELLLKAVRYLCFDLLDPNPSIIEEPNLTYVFKENFCQRICFSLLLFSFFYCEFSLKNTKECSFKLKLLSFKNGLKKQVNFSLFCCF